MNFNLYKLELILITAFTCLVTIVTCVPWSNFYRNWINCLIDMFLLCITGAVVRSAISQNVTFFHKLYKKHRFEFNKQASRELPK